MPLRAAEALSGEKATRGKTALRGMCNAPLSTGYRFLAEGYSITSLRQGIDMRRWQKEADYPGGLFVVRRLCARRGEGEQNGCLFSRSEL